MRKPIKSKLLKVTPGYSKVTPGYSKVTPLAILILSVLSVPCPAAQFSSKGSGLTSVPKIESLEQVEEVLREQARAIDYIHRSLHTDIDSINRDEVPDLQSQIDAIEIGASDFDIPMLRDVAFSYLADNIIEWTDGELDYAGTTYTVNAGQSDAGDIIVYVDVAALADPDPVTFAHATAVTYAQGWWVLAYRNSTTVYQVLQSPVIHGGLIQANTITASQIDAGAITADEIATGTITANELASNSITVGDMDATAAGRLFSSSTAQGGVEGWASDGAFTYVAPGKVFISGTTLLSDWQHATHATYINGGSIATDSITATQIDVTDLFAEDITVTNEIHSANKTAYGDTDAGWWMGVESDTPKFSIGDGTYYLKWTGTDLELNAKTGSLGGTTSYFDVTNGRLKTKDTTNNIWVVVGDGELAIGANEDGTNPKTFAGHNGTIYCMYTTHFSVGLSAATVDAPFRSAYYEGGGTAYADTTIKSLLNGNIKIVIDDDPVTGTGTEYSINQFEINNCTLASGSGNTIDGSLITGGTIANARIPNLASKTLTTCSATNGFGLYAATAATIKELDSPATGAIAFATDVGVAGIVVYYDGTNWRTVNSQSAI